MSPEVIQNAMHKQPDLSMIAQMTLNESFICNDPDCSIISNRNGECPCGQSNRPLASFFGTPINALAHEIADLASKTSIWSFCITDVIDKQIWHNTAVEIDILERGDVDRAVKYLAATGALIRHPHNAALVRWE